MAVQAGEDQTATAGSAVAVPPAVLVQDAEGNAVEGIEVTFTTEGGSLTGSPALTGADGIARLESWTLSPIAGENTLVASAAGLDDVAFTATGTALPGVVAHLSATPDGDILADGVATATLTLEVEDPTGQPLSRLGAEDIELLLPAEAVAELGPVTPLGAGRFEATLANTRAETLTVQARIEGDIVAETQIRFVAGLPDPDETRIDVSRNEAEADGSTPILVEATLRDGHGNPVSGGIGTVRFTTDLGTMLPYDGAVTKGPIFARGSQTAVASYQGDGRFFAYLVSNDLGTATITATLNNLRLGAVAQVVFREPEVAAAGARLSASPQRILADGKAQSIITVQATNGVGANLTAGGARVTLTTTLGQLGPVVDQGDGRYSATLTAATVAGSAVVRGTFNGAPIGTETQVEMVVDRDHVAAALADATSAFVAQRMERLLSSEPAAYALPNRRAADGRVNLTYATQPGSTGGLEFQWARTSPSGAIHTWAEGKSLRETADSSDSFAVLHAGVDRLLRPDLSLGLMLSLDRGADKGEGEAISGNGWSIGPYLSWEMQEDLFLTARLAVGGSNNRVAKDVYGEGRAFAGQFSTTRSLAMLSIEGRYTLGAVRVAPQMGLQMMRESYGSYLVSDGISEVRVPGDQLSTGRLTLGLPMEIPLRQSDRAPILFLAPEYRLMRSSSRAGSSDGSDYALELGLRTGPEAKWQGEVALRYDSGSEAGARGIELRSALELRF